jgi:hypothetical protein
MAEAKPRVFFPQSLLDILLDLGKVDLVGEALVLSEHGLRYEAEEAIRVTGEVTTGEDPRDIVGKVTPRTYLTDELGAELLGNSMLIEDSAYDVIPGFTGTPTGDADDAAKGNEIAILTQLQNIEDEL